MSEAIPNEDAVAGVEGVSDEELKATIYYVPTWDCPVCEWTNYGTGQDYFVGPQQCENCGEIVDTRE